MFPLKPYTLAGFEPGCSRSWDGYDVHCATPAGHFVKCYVKWLTVGLGNHDMAPIRITID
jgi:hypothetical protein